jgi:hypothetical protein
LNHRWSLAFFVWLLLIGFPNGTYGAGQVSRQTDANGKNTYYAYTALGKPYRTWGDVPYPSEYVYSEYGEMVELHTFRGGVSGKGESPY